MLFDIFFVAHFYLTSHFIICEQANFQGNHPGQAPIQYNPMNPNAHGALVQGITNFPENVYTDDKFQRSSSFFLRPFLKLQVSCMSRLSLKNVTPWERKNALPRRNPVGVSAFLTPACLMKCVSISFLKSIIRQIEYGPSHHFIHDFDKKIILLLGPAARRRSKVTWLVPHRPARVLLPTPPLLRKQFNAYVKLQIPSAS